MDQPSCPDSNPTGAVWIATYSDMMQHYFNTLKPSHTGNCIKEKGICSNLKSSM